MAKTDEQLFVSKIPNSRNPRHVVLLFRPVGRSESAPFSQNLHMRGPARRAVAGPTSEIGPHGAGKVQMTNDNSGLRLP